MVRIAQVMGHRWSRKPHEVARGDLELLVVNLRDTTTGDHVDLLLLPLVGVVDEGLLARGDTDQAYAGSRQPDQCAQAGPDELRVRVPRVRETARLLGYFVRLYEKPLL